MAAGFMNHKDLESGTSNEVEKQQYIMCGVVGAVVAALLFGFAIICCVDLGPKIDTVVRLFAEMTGDGGRLGGEQSSCHHRM